MKGVYVVATLGEFPKTGLKEAKALAEGVVKARLCSGGDTPEAVLVPTVKEVFEQWFDVKKTRIKNHIDIRRRFDNYILPEFGGKRLNTVAAHHLIASIQKTLGAAGKLETIKRLCGEIKQLEVFAMNCGFIESLRLQGLSAAFESPSWALCTVRTYRLLSSSRCSTSCTPRR